MKCEAGDVAPHRRIGNLAPQRSPGPAIRRLVPRGFFRPRRDDKTTGLDGNVYFADIATRQTGRAVTGRGGPRRQRAGRGVQRVWATGEGHAGGDFIARLPLKLKKKMEPAEVVGWGIACRTPGEHR
jgi:hypothetical protein